MAALNILMCMIFASSSAPPNTCHEASRKWGDALAHARPNCDNLDESVSLISNKMPSRDEARRIVAHDREICRTLSGRFRRLTAVRRL